MVHLQGHRNGGAVRQAAEGRDQTPRPPTRIQAA
jgi:hypothetical protein